MRMLCAMHGGLSPIQAEGTSGGLGLQLSPLSSLLGKNKPGGNKKIKNVVVMGMISQLEEVNNDVIAPIYQFSHVFSTRALWCNVKYAVLDADLVLAT